MKKCSLLNLYFIFVKIGAILIGGGYVILPIITDELAKKRQLISEEEILNYFALAQSMPGIIAANISMLAGYKLRGKYGAVAAMLGIITVPFFIIVMFASLLDNIMQNKYIQAVFWGIGYSVIALILLTACELWQKSEKNFYFYAIFFGALVSLLVFNFSPIQTIIALTIIGLVVKKLTAKEVEI